ncbi:MAG: hypothetical protein VB133_07435 [Anaeromusa sp.]|uniref:hypothetical protein n=1 Tax=Anaeromusa sp. TaxID=1872520 RepID=UPI002B2057DF|nr:hypothetical protein [Anaeromusa sp.]MEA4834948.1 hypothetical protein [Anaeromusa sp.]
MMVCKSLTIKSILLACLLGCFLWAVPGTCSAAEATYQITESELVQLQTNLTKLEKNYKVLLQDSTTSSKQLIEALNELSEAKQSLEKCKSELTTTQQSLVKAQASLQTANELFQQYAKEEKAKQNKLEWQRNLAIIAAMYFASRK